MFQSWQHDQNQIKSKKSAMTNSFFGPCVIPVLAPPHFRGTRLSLGDFDRFGSEERISLALRHVSIAFKTRS